MPDEGEVQVHVVDDDPGLCQSLRRLFNSAGMSAAVYESGPAFLRIAGTISTGCVLLDVRMPGMNGRELLLRLRAKGFALPIVMMSGHGDIATAVQAMKDGANDFIEKQSDDTVFLDTVRRVMNAQDNQKRSKESQEAALRIAVLTPRERQVLYGIANGHSSKAIAFELGLSVRTIEVYRARMMERLGLRNTAEAVRLAVLARFTA